MKGIEPLASFNDDFTSPNSFAVTLPLSTIRGNSGKSADALIVRAIYLVSLSVIVYSV